MGWTRVRLSDIKPDRLTGPHKWRRYRFLPWEVCSRCGLIALRNEPTEKAIRLGCDYKNILKQRGQ